MKHIVHTITSLHRGGAEQLLITLVHELKNYGYRQSVIFFKDGPLRTELTALGIPTYQVHYFSFFRVIRKLKPDLIHSALWSSNILARLAGWLFSISVFCALHAHAHHAGTLRTLIDYLLPVSPQAYIAVSEAVKKSYTGWLPATKIVTIENGISLSHKASAEQVRQKNYTYTIGAVGRFVPVKNFDILLAAFARIHHEFPHTKLMLIGHGPLETALRNQAHRLSLTDPVTFVINQPARDYYPLFDSFVQPSASEGLSMALLEAMDAGCAVIATATADHPHACIVDKKTGLLIEPNNEQALYNALRFYVEHPEMGKTHAAAAHHMVHERFSAQAMAARYHALFTEK